MTWLRAKLRQWLGIDSDISACVDLVATVENSVINRCQETQSYCVGGLAAHNVEIMAHARTLDALTRDSADHNTRLLDLRTSVVNLETKPAPPKTEREVLEPAGSWTVTKGRASRGQDAA